MERLSSLTEDLNQKMMSRDLARWLSCLWQAGGRAHVAVDDFDRRYGRSMNFDYLKKTITDLSTKAAVPPGSTSDGQWASPLVPALFTNIGFIPLIEQTSLFGRTPGLRLVPFNAKVARQTGAGAFWWVGQGVPKGVTALAFDSATLRPLKSVGVVVVSEELATFSARNSENALLDALVAGVTTFVDGQFLDPTVAAVPGISPASITNGVAATPSTGNFATDIATLMAAFFAARPGAAAPTFFASPGTIAAMAATGVHPGLSVTGGVYNGIPVVPTTGAGGNLVLVDARAIIYGDGGVLLDVSRNGAIEMSDSPSGPTASTIFTSFWQENLVGLKAEIVRDWSAAPGSVQYLAAA
jgi:hypothetical protein